MASFSVVVRALACTMLFVLATRHMMDRTFVKSVTQVNLIFLPLISYLVLVVIEVSVFICVVIYLVMCRLSCDNCYCIHLCCDLSSDV